ncbi:MAG: acyltransferase [Pseudomonadota bacterium]
MSTIDRLEIKAPSPIVPLMIGGKDESHALYGSYIGVQFVFADTLDTAVLREAISNLLKEMPALGARGDFWNWRIISGPGVTLEVIEEEMGSALDYEHPGTVQPDRYRFVYEPKRDDVFRGKAPLSTFRLTRFPDGSSILGIGMSHSYTDANGFHQICKRLSVIYRDRLSGKKPDQFTFLTKLDVFKFGKGRNKDEVIAALSEENMPKPIRVRGVIGSLWRRLIVSTMERNRKTGRAAVYLSKEQVAKLKNTVHGESNEGWISTNAALGAHFTRLMVKLQYGDTAKPMMQVSQVLDLRGRYFDEQRDMQLRYIGNPISLYTSTAKFPRGFQNASRGEIAGFLKGAIASLSGEKLRRRLDLIEDAIKAGFTHPGLDIKNPIVSFNNQSKMSVYGIDFGIRLLRVIPQDVGDHIMVFPTLDGGVEVYMRDLVKPGRQEVLNEPEWQERLFDF